MTKKNSEKFQKIISQGSLTKEEQQLWQNFFELSNVEIQKSLIEIFDRFPEELVWFTKMLKIKINALEIMKKNPQKGEEFIEKIKEEEKNKIIELLSKIK